MGSITEIYAANNDIEDTVVVMPYEDDGKRRTGASLLGSAPILGFGTDQKSDELAVTVEVQNTIVFYRREVKGVEAPTRRFAA